MDVINKNEHKINTRRNYIMNIEQNKKVHLNSLCIIVGTKCNLKCEHCFGGHPAPMELDIKYIDDIIDNITWIDELQFIGYEISLYTEKIEEIMNRFIRRNIRVNKLFFFTNGRIYNEKLAKIFNDFRYDHTTHPEKAHFQISTDEFHLNSGFDKKTLELNINKYKQVIKNVQIVEFNLENGLKLFLDTYEMPAEKIKSCNHVMIDNPNRKRYEFQFRPKCEGIMNTCNNGKCVCNCIVNPVILLPNGYIYVIQDMAFHALANNHFDDAIGRIDELPLFDMVMNYHANTSDYPLVKDIIFQNKNSLWWMTQYELLYKYIQYRENIISAIKNKNRYAFDKLIICVNSFVNSAKKKLKKIYEMEIDDETRIYFNQIFTKINTDIDKLHTAGDNYLRMGLFETDSEKELNMDMALTTSDFSESNFRQTLGFTYKNFMKLWIAYDSCNLNEYVETANDLLSDFDGKIIEQ